SHSVASPPRQGWGNSRVIGDDSPSLPPALLPVYIGTMKVPFRVGCLLLPGDGTLLGGVPSRMTIITRRESEEGPSEAAASAPPQVGVVAIFPPSAPQYTVFPLKGASLHLGRDELITAGIHDEYTSKRHLQLDWNGHSLWVSDAGSMNGTFLDGRRVTSRA